MTDSLLFLTCADGGAIATKKIILGKDGTLEKVPFSAGKHFEWEEVAVEDIMSLGAAIQSRESQPKTLLVRGKITNGASRRILRRMVANGGSIEDTPRHWVMLDIDDFPLPHWMNPANDPDAAVKWVRAALPKPFRKATCYYQFSSGQNVPKRKGDPPPKIAKLHMFFWLERAVTAEQLRDWAHA